MPNSREEMYQWSFYHPPLSSGIILISSDREVGRRLSFLHNVGYDLLLVHGPNLSETLEIIVENRMLWQDVQRLHTAPASCKIEVLDSSSSMRSGSPTLATDAQAPGSWPTSSSLPKELGDVEGDSQLSPELPATDKGKAVAKQS